MAVVTTEAGVTADDLPFGNCDADRQNKDFPIYTIASRPPSRARPPCATAPAFRCDAAGTDIAEAFTSIAGRICHHSVVIADCDRVVQIEIEPIDTVSWNLDRGDALHRPVDHDQPAGRDDQRRGLEHRSHACPGLRLISAHVSVDTTGQGNA